MTLDTKSQMLVRLTDEILGGMGTFNEMDAARRLRHVTRDWTNKPFALHEQVGVYWHDGKIVFVSAVNQASYEATYPDWETPDEFQWWEYLEEHIFKYLRGIELPTGDSPKRPRETNRQKRQRERRAVGTVLRQNRMH